MNFKEKIQAHNAGGYDFTGELISLALSDCFKTTMTVTYNEHLYTDFTLPPDEQIEETVYLPHWRPEYSEGKTYEEKLARNFKVMIARYTRKANGIRKKKEFEGTQEKLMNVNNDRLHYIYSKLIEYGYHYYKDDFDKLPLKMIYKRIEKREGIYERTAFRNTIKPFLDILPHINRDKQKLLDQYIPLIEDAIIEVLPRVDLQRTERDIIAYIAVSVRNNVNRKITKLLESKVHQIDGEKYYLSKEQIRAKKFNKTKANTILKINEKKLTANQYVFFDMLCRQIEEEFKALNVHPFTFDKEGNPININKRYFAKKMGMNESAFKQRLRRFPKSS
ncbi:MULTISPECIES: hypothetical protein [unclassified Sporosarcina]|uniref:hypothetical protein n=1 Tax=unclassified Sporosarcina TaxID=2647733 RepID=UPI00203E8488|nr:MULTISPECIES: hypothetical protein [unclassified Sporosarcina]GKV64101.1 hypothetical protein NCCP2331_02540 [Sporosarcina sp. NCCP-2331]GLB54434.1 hypothetical protein NCCP2378_02190 [Sporosarcina sp. NCCP-2378]